MSWGWDIDPPYKAYEEWERWHDAPIDDEEEPEEPEYDHDWYLEEEQ
jgi:hypothetical protein